MLKFKIFPWRGFRRLVWRFKWSTLCPEWLRPHIRLTPYDPKKHLEPFLKKKKG